jgi:hypothetical protein
MMAKVLSATLLDGTIGPVASLIEATLYEGLASCEKYSPNAGTTLPISLFSVHILVAVTFISSLIFCL